MKFKENTPWTLNQDNVNLKSDRSVVRYRCNPSCL